MASSSVSQEDIENDYELCSRRSKIRAARAHKITPPSKIDSGMIGDDEGGDTSHGGDVGCLNTSDHDVSPKPASSARVKDKRVNRTNHMNKGKAQRDRRKLREKRRSTGVVHLPSTESTNGSTGEDDDEELGANEKETKKNTQHNEFSGETGAHSKDALRGNRKLEHTSASDLEADDEENGGSASRSSTNNDDPSPPRVAENGGSAECGGPHGLNGVSGSTVAGAAGRLALAAAKNNKSNEVIELLEKSLDENKKLSSLLETRNTEVAALEAAVRQLKAQLDDVVSEASKLREENAALVKAVGSLSSRD